MDDVNRYIERCPIGLSRDYPYVLRARNYASLNKYSLALSNYLMARRLNPDSFAPMQGSWFCYYMLGHFEIAAYEAKAMRLSYPNKAHAQAACCIAFAQVGMAREAIEAGERAIELDPKNPEFNIALGNALLHERKFTESLAQYEKAFELDSTCEIALRRKGLLLALCPDKSIRNLADAKKIADSLLEKNSGEDYSALLILAATEANKGDYDKALELCRESLTLGSFDFPFKLICERCQTAFEKKQPYTYQEADLINKDGTAKASK